MKKKSNHKERKHSRMSASNSERWLNCAASVALAEKAPIQPESKYATLGTEAHEHAEKALNTYLATNKFSDRSIPERFRSGVKDYVNYIASIIDKCSSPETLVETKVSLEFIDSELFGTLDCAVVELFGYLHIVDYKNGSGYAVSATRNTQLLYYALGIAEKYDWCFEKVKLHIVQPYCSYTPDEDDFSTTYEITIEELKSWIPIFAKGVERVKKNKSKPFSGKWCKWCPAAVICPEAKNAAFSDVKESFDPVEATPQYVLPHPTDLQPEQLSTILNKAKAVEGWIETVREYAQDFMERGGTLPDWKLVDKRATRKWSDEEKVFKFAKDCVNNNITSLPWYFDLKSPTQFEKGMPEKVFKKHFEKYVTKESSGLTIAPVSDKREQIIIKQKTAGLIASSKGESNGDTKKRLVKGKSKR